MEYPLQPDSEGCFTRSLVTGARVPTMVALSPHGSGDEFLSCRKGGGSFLW